MSRPNHPLRFTPYTDVVQAGMKSLIVDAEGTVVLQFPDGTTSHFVATKGTQYNMNFDRVVPASASHIAAASGVTGTAFF
tara:strand:+ start:3528 stop:3767 length:240 start_codon:yes stop_codon:yes gene_type:complete